MGSGIEVTAHCPVLMSQYRMNKVELEIDGESHAIPWDRPTLYEVSPGPHKVHAQVRGLVTSGAGRSLDVSVEAGRIMEVSYSLTLLSVINPGKLELKGTRPAAGAAMPAAESTCPKCHAVIPAGARYCGECGESATSGVSLRCASCGQAQTTGKYCFQCGAKLPPG